MIPVGDDGTHDRADPQRPHPGASVSGRNEVAVALHGLTRRFTARVVVNELSFSVQRGELFGLVGPDGAGKTTTLRMLAGILPPSAGDALVLGMSIAREQEQVKPHIAYMAQRFGLYEDLTVRENIEFYADLYCVPRADRLARIDRLHAFSGLGEFEHRLAGALSGGMKQKLALSCALVHRPTVLLLDEPTFGVDPISRRDLWLILHEMVAEGVTLLLSTSYLDEAERCDRVALLDDGRLVALDQPAVLQRSLEGELYTVRAPDPRRARDILRESPGVRLATLFGRNIHVQFAPDASPESALARLTDAGLTAQHSEPIEPSLEDVFIDRVAKVRTPPAR